MTSVASPPVVKLMQNARNRVASVALSAGLVFGLACNVHGGNAHHVVVVVWDGMRPDFITEQTSPNLFQLSRRGVFFQNHHPVFVSSTEVNGTAIATGCYPQSSGVIANREFRPAIDSMRIVATEDMKTIRKGDALEDGHYLKRATVAEILRTNGMKTAIAGSKPVALLHDRADRDDASGSRLVFEGETLPASLKASVVEKLGPMPGANPGKTARDEWTTRALTEVLWRDGVPAYSLLWLAEPDFTQHRTSPGSGDSLAVIRGSDARLGDVIQELSRQKVLDDTDILVVSDHAFSTCTEGIDVAVELSQAGFTTARGLTASSDPDTVLVSGLGGCVALYVPSHKPEVVDRLVRHLQTTPYAGVLFSRTSIEGTFPMETVLLNTTNAPDVLVAFRWNSQTNGFGTTGGVYVEGTLASPAGTHASLSHYDMHNTLVAAGPDFRQGVFDPLPSGNTDLAPTILWILGVQPLQLMDGRVLTEALTVPGPRLESVDLQQLTARRTLDSGTWSQTLNVSRLNGVTYFDEGNGGFQK